MSMSRHKIFSQLMAPWFSRKNGRDFRAPNNLSSVWWKHCLASPWRRHQISKSHGSCLKIHVFPTWSLFTRGMFLVLYNYLMSSLFSLTKHTFKLKKIYFVLTSTTAVNKKIIQNNSNVHHWQVSSCPCQPMVPTGVPPCYLRFPGWRW